MIKAMPKYRVIKTLAFILLIEGCKIGYVKKENDFCQYRVIKNNMILYKSLILIQTKNNDTFKLKYSDSSYQAIYYLSSHRKFNDFVVYNRKDTQQLSFVGKRIYRLGKDNFDIYKYIENKGVTDGEFCLFWSPNYGILVERSNTWRNIRKLISSGREKQDDTIAILCDIIFGDIDFYANEIPNSTIKFITPSVKKEQ